MSSTVPNPPTVRQRLWDLMSVVGLVVSIVSGIVGILAWAGIEPAPDAFTRFRIWIARAIAPEIPQVLPPTITVVPEDCPPVASENDANVPTPNGGDRPRQPPGITVVPEGAFQLSKGDSVKLTDQGIPFALVATSYNRSRAVNLNGEGITMRQGVPVPVPGTDCDVWWVDSGDGIDGNLFELRC